MRDSIPLNKNDIRNMSEIEQIEFFRNAWFKTINDMTIKQMEMLKYVRGWDDNTYKKVLKKELKKIKKPDRDFIEMIIQSYKKYCGDEWL